MWLVPLQFHHASLCEIIKNQPLCYKLYWKLFQKCVYQIFAVTAISKMDFNLSLKWKLASYETKLKESNSKYSIQESHETVCSSVNVFAFSLCTAFQQNKNLSRLNLQNQYFNSIIVHNNELRQNDETVYDILWWGVLWNTLCRWSSWLQIKAVKVLPKPLTSHCIIPRVTIHDINRKVLSGPP